MLSFLKGTAGKQSDETKAQNLNASAYASKNFANIKKTAPKEWPLGGFVILCIDSVTEPAENTTQYAMELVKRCNMECEYTAMAYDLKPGVVMVGSPTAKIKDAADFGTFVMNKGFKSHGVKNIYMIDDYTAKRNMKNLPQGTGLPPSYSQ